MSSYFRRHATMGAVAMLTLVAVCIARHTSSSYFILLSVVGVAQVIVVRALGRRMPR